MVIPCTSRAPVDYTTSATFRSFERNKEKRNDDTNRPQWHQARLNVPSRCPAGNYGSEHDADSRAREYALDDDRVLDPQRTFGESRKRDGSAFANRRTTANHGSVWQQFRRAKETTPRIIMSCTPWRRPTELLSRTSETITPKTTVKRCKASRSTAAKRGARPTALACWLRLGRRQGRVLTWLRYDPRLPNLIDTQRSGLGI